MKKMGVLAILGLCCFMTACGKGNKSSDQTTTVETVSDASEETTEVELIPELTGTWKESGDLGEMYHVASISEDSIWVYWYDTVDASYTLYWAGSLKQPESKEKYTWTSVNDHDKTDTSILASGDDTKEFTYEDGKISYECSISGTTRIVSLESSDVDMPTSLLATSAKEEQMQMDEIASKLDVKCEVANKKVIYVFVTNNSKYKVNSIQLKLTLKDADGKKVDYQENSLEQVLAGSTVVRKFITETDYEDYEIQEEIDANSIIYSDNYAEDVSVESNRSGNNIIVDCTNNGECDIDNLNCVVVVYKEGKVVDSEDFYYSISDIEGVYDFKKGTTETIKYEIPEGVSFDDYKIFINGAYVY